MSFPGEASVGFRSAHEVSGKADFRNFSALLACVVLDQSVETSPVVRVGSCAFAIKLWPNGNRRSMDGVSDGMAIHVRRTDQSEETVWCAYQISILDGNGEPVNSETEDMPQLFVCGASWGWAGWDARTGGRYRSVDECNTAYRTRLKAFQDKGYFHDDVLTVGITLKLFLGRPGNIVPTPLQAQDGISCLAADVARLLDEGVATDVSLVCSGGQAVQAHRLILSARSPVFRAMFGSKMREAQSGEVKLDETEQPMLSHFLHYLYNGSLIEGLPEVELWAVIALAHRYEVEVLLEECAQRLQAKLTTDNAATFLAEADRLSIDCLKSAALDFMVRDSGTLEEVQASAAYDVLPAALLKELLACATGTRKRRREPGSREFSDDTDWAALTVPRLKMALAERGLPTSGQKALLVIRLNESRACTPT